MIGKVTSSLKNGKTIGFAILLSMPILLTQTQLSFAKCWCVWPNQWGPLDPARQTYYCKEGNPSYTTDSDCSESCRAFALSISIFLPIDPAVAGAASLSSCEAIIKKITPKERKNKTSKRKTTK